MLAVKGTVRKHGNRWHWSLIVQASTEHATVYFDNEKSQQLALHMLEAAYADHCGVHPVGYEQFPYKVKEVNYIGFDNYDQVA